MNKFSLWVLQELSICVQRVCVCFFWGGGWAGFSFRCFLPVFCLNPFGLIERALTRTVSDFLEVLKFLVHIYVKEKAGTKIPILYFEM